MCIKDERIDCDTSNGINMIFKKRLYILIVFILIIFASVMLAFVMQKDHSEDYKGTLVKEQMVELDI
jgi:uncharacterized protein involved in exopolysaccharide biosynthesis